jgi:hypothetical protein
LTPPSQVNNSDNTTFAASRSKGDHCEPHRHGRAYIGVNSVKEDSRRMCAVSGNDLDQKPPSEWRLIAGGPILLQCGISVTTEARRNGWIDHFERCQVIDYIKRFECPWMNKPFRTLVKEREVFASQVDSMRSATTVRRRLKHSGSKNY